MLQSTEQCPRSIHLHQTRTHEPLLLAMIGYSPYTPTVSYLRRESCCFRRLGKLLLPR